MSNFLTIHQLVSLPWSNLNRDDSGTPKRLHQGGALRGMLSSQSIKRSARMAYEAASQNISVRSAHLAKYVAERAVELNPSLDADEAMKAARRAIGALTKSAEKEDQESNRSVWMSGEEIETAALAVAGNEEEIIKTAGFMGGGASGSLSIAAFGRMLANAPQQNVEAALAVSPAISTHRVIIDTDYFTTVDDWQIKEHGAGSSYLGVAQFVNGVFYRTSTIDKAQLQRSWTGINNPEAKAQLRAMIEALIYALPQGKKNSTAPYVMPDLLLAEEQNHRIAYDFERPVDVDADGGFVVPSIKRLEEQYRNARAFDSSNFEGLNLVSGVNNAAREFATDLHIDYAAKDQFIGAIVDWIVA